MAPVRHVATALAASVTAVSALYVNGSVIAPCDSPIYCHGDILEQVELAQPFSDSKTFVDMYVVVVPLLSGPLALTHFVGQPFDLWKRFKRHLTSSKNLLETIRLSRTFSMRILLMLVVSLKKYLRMSLRRIPSFLTRLMILSSRSLRKRSLIFGLI